MLGAHSRRRAPADLNEAEVARQLLRCLHALTQPNLSGEPAEAFLAVPRILTDRALVRLAHGLINACIRVLKLLWLDLTLLHVQMCALIFGYLGFYHREASLLQVTHDVVGCFTLLGCSDAIAERLVVGLGRRLASLHAQISVGVLLLKSADLWALAERGFPGGHRSILLLHFALRIVLHLGQAGGSLLLEARQLREVESMRLTAMVAFINVLKVAVLVVQRVITLVRTLFYHGIISI